MTAQADRVRVEFLGIQPTLRNGPGLVLVNEPSGTTVTYKSDRHYLEGFRVRLLTRVDGIPYKPGAKITVYRDYLGRIAWKIGERFVYLPKGSHEGVKS